MSEPRALAFVAVAAVLLAGCDSIPTELPGASALSRITAGGGAYSLTSDPPGALILVRDCPTCKGKFLAETPYSGAGPTSGLEGKYLSAVLDGYRLTEPLEVQDPQRRQFHFNLIPSERTGETTGAAAVEDQRNGGGVTVTSTVRTSSYRSKLIKEKAVYEPMTTDTEFLVVSAIAGVNPGQSTAGVSQDPSQLAGYEAHLLATGSSRQRKPTFSHRRMAKQGLEIEYVFTVARSESGPYRLQIGGRTFPLTSPPGAGPVSGSVAGPSRPSAIGAPVTAAVAGTAAAAAVGGSVAGGGDYRLCARVERYELCGDRPCRADGLMSKTSLSCRSSRCASAEMPGASTWEFGSLVGCVTACRKAEANAVSQGNQGTIPVYCMQ